MFRKLLLSILTVLFSAGTAVAAHPLITDDAGTQGKGKFLFCVERNRRIDQIISWRKLGNSLLMDQ